MKELIESKMKEMVALAQAGLTRQEFLDAFKTVMASIKKMEADCKAELDAKCKEAENKLAELAQQHEDTIKRVESESQSTFSNVKKWAFEAVGKLFIKSKINDKIEEVNSKLNELNDFVAPDVSAIALEASKLAEKNLLPLIPKLEKKEEAEEEELEIKHIKGLEDAIKELKRQVLLPRPAYALGIQGGGRVTKMYDLSPLLNGVTKVFNVPHFWRVISITSSSFPTTFQINTDYVHDAGLNTITFTSAIDAPTALATGNTITVVYGE